MEEMEVRQISKGVESNTVAFDFEHTPITQIADYIIISASKSNASDIHFDPRENGMMVRFRIDGDLQDYTFIPKANERNLTTRLKLLANMNITESRLPQDGAIKGDFGGTYLDMRVSCLPLNEGEKIVIRILDYTRSLQGIDSLGFNKTNLSKIKRMMAAPNGIILVTGATGSGKSTTVYSILQGLNKPEVNIITVEDPIEMNIQGMNQVQVNAEIGMTFAAALRSILRQDPNVILIGEIRDSETAQIAVRASITGHLVLSTIHTNNSLATIERLLDMDVERYLLSTSLTGIISQRLAKQLCPYCKVERETTKYEKRVFKKYMNMDVAKIYDANEKGCEHCRKGYKGRIAIHEVLEFDDEIRNAVSNAKLKKEELAAMVYGGKTISMLQDALGKAIAGLTSFEEVYRVIEIESTPEDGDISYLTRSLDDADEAATTATEGGVDIPLPNVTTVDKQEVKIEKVENNTYINQVAPTPANTAVAANAIPATQPPVTQTNLVEAAAAAVEQKAPVQVQTQPQAPVQTPAQPQVPTTQPVTTPQAVPQTTPTTQPATAAPTTPVTTPTQPATVAPVSVQVQINKTPTAPATQPTTVPQTTPTTAPTTQPKTTGIIPTITPSAPKQEPNIPVIPKTPASDKKSPVVSIIPNDEPVKVPSALSENKDIKDIKPVTGEPAVPAPKDKVKEEAKKEEKTTPSININIAKPVIPEALKATPPKKEEEHKDAPTEIFKLPSQIQAEKEAKEEKMRAEKEAKEKADLEKRKKEMEASIPELNIKAKEKVEPLIALPKEAVEAEEKEFTEKDKVTAPNLNDLNKAKDLDTKAKENTPLIPTIAKKDLQEEKKNLNLTKDTDTKKAVDSALLEKVKPVVPPLIPKALMPEEDKKQSQPVVTKTPTKVEKIEKLDTAAVKDEKDKAKEKVKEEKKEPTKNVKLVEADTLAKLKEKRAKEQETKKTRSKRKPNILDTKIFKDEN